MPFIDVELENFALTTVLRRRSEYCGKISLDNTLEYRTLLAPGINFHTLCANASSFRL